MRQPVRWLTAVVVLACGPGAAPPMPQAEAPTTLASRPQPSPPEPLPPQPERVRGEPRLVGALEPELAERLPGAELVSVRTPEDRVGEATVAGPGYRLHTTFVHDRERDRAWFRHRHELAAMGFLQALSEAGVDLGRIAGRYLPLGDTFFECVSEGGGGEPAYGCQRVAAPPPEESPPSLAPPFFLLPPSQRAPRRWPPIPRLDGPSDPAAVPLTQALAAHSLFEVQGLATDEEHQLILVTGHDVATWGALLCLHSVSHGESASLQCRATQLESLKGVVRVASWGWLILAGTTYGNHREASRVLAAVRPTRAGPAEHILELGRVSGHGHGCDNHPGYCVDFVGRAYRARVLAPDCVERFPGPSWGSTHVRVGDHWIRERIIPAPECAERFEFGPEGWQPSDCGPPTRPAACPDELPTVPYP